MAIKPLKDVFTNPTPKNLPEAIGTAVGKYMCRQARTLKSVASATYSLPLGALADFWKDNACPGGALPSPNYPTVPFPGGQCPFLYNVRIRLLNHSVDCTVASDVNRVDVVRGPISFRSTFVRMEKYDCKPDPVPLLRGSYVNGNGDIIDIGNYSPAVGGFCFISPSPQSGGADDCGHLPPEFPGYPDPEYPPGWPDAPYLPPEVVPVPVFPPIVPIVPVFVLPKVEIPILPGFKPNIPVDISVPIDIPVSFDFGGNTFNWTVQIDGDGNYRDPPDVLPPAPGDKICPAVPETSPYEVIYYDCVSSSPGVRSEVISVVSGSVSDILTRKLAETVVLAEEACKSLSPAQVDPVLISRGRSGSVNVVPQYSAVIPGEVVSVELRVSGYSKEDYKPVSWFPGDSQRKFGAMAYCLDGSTGGAEPTYVFDEKTYLRLPKRAKPGKVKLMLRSGISWELWDTGERF